MFPECICNHSIYLTKWYHSILVSSTCTKWPPCISSTWKWDSVIIELNFYCISCDVFCMNSVPNGPMYTLCWLIIPTSIEDSFIVMRQTALPIFIYPLWECEEQANVNLLANLSEAVMLCLARHARFISHKVHLTPHTTSYRIKAACPLTQSPRPQGFHVDAISTARCKSPSCTLECTLLTTDCFVFTPT